MKSVSFFTWIPIAEIIDIVNRSQLVCEVMQRVTLHWNWMPSELIQAWTHQRFWERNHTQTNYKKETWRFCDLIDNLIHCKRNIAQAYEIPVNRIPNEARNAYTLWNCSKAKSCGKYKQSENLFCQSIAMIANDLPSRTFHDSIGTCESSSFYFQICWTLSWQSHS